MANTMNTKTAPVVAETTPVVTETVTPAAETIRTFKVLASKRFAFEKEMARLTRKASKLGVAAPTFTMGAATFEERTGTREDGSSYKYIAEFYPTTVTAIIVQIPGWTFLATLEHLEGGETLVRAIADGVDTVAYRTATSKCDHCKIARKRNDTYLVRNDATGQIVQIGRTCIADFLGHKNPEHLARLAEFVADAVGFDEESWSDGAGEDIAETLAFQTIVQALVRTKGFVGKKAAEEQNRQTTSITAFIVLFPSPKQEAFAKEFLATVTAEDGVKAQASIDWVLGLDGEVNDFIHNVRAITRTGIVKCRTAGYAAALSVAYARAMDDLRVKAERPVSKHVGTVGERTVFTLTINKIIATESQFGTSYLHIMTDAEGNDLKWFSSGGTLWLDMGLGVPGRDAAEGDTVTVKATVKSHTEYKGRAQTMLTRAAIYTAPAPKVKKPRAKKAASAVEGL